MIDSLLSNIQSLITVSHEEKEIISSLFKVKTYKKGEFFLADGQICKHVGFIAKGLMRYYINHDGEEKTYAFSQENQYSLLDSHAITFNGIEALEDGQYLRFLTIRREALLKLESEFIINLGLNYKFFESKDSIPINQFDLFNVGE